MERGAAELFALGTVSGRPGLYLARKVAPEGVALGVIVVKIEFDRLEAKWADTRGTSFVTDGSGIIIMASDPAWRFRALAPLSGRARDARSEERRVGKEGVRTRRTRGWPLPLKKKTQQ